MAEDLFLPYPVEEEEIAEGGIVATSDGDMHTPLHEERIEPAEDGAARVVGHIGDHASEVGIVEADGVVVVVIEERALEDGAGGVIGAALFLPDMPDHRRRARRLHIAGYLAAPAGGNGALDILDDGAEAFVHPFLYDYHAMPMVGHAYLRHHFYLAPLRCLDGGGLFPLLLYYLTGGSKDGGRIVSIIVERREARLATCHNEGDEVCASFVIVMTRVMGAI